ncbi:LuxR C-terminal-related transcriptional regulator [Sanguibacter gelidistatuariae]|uniref:LuxR C-terminal-related transcriptional regulator n=1 Tax=Sanguibacter gelidistatuariae TaxID=1814289 RepID=UPI001587FA6B|nr:LuxR C-terminal-related transcriptional regulator [Sanguibacter gelidistatuariae]
MTLALGHASRWPRTPSVFVVKASLIGLLDRREPLTIVRGPRGYGKTSLVSHWVRSLPDEVSVVWVSGRTAPGDDAGPVPSLWDLVADSMVGSGLLQLPENGASGRTEVIHALASSQGETCLVVDDFDQVRDPRVEADLLDLLRRFPGLSLVLCMRDVASVETVLAATIDSVVIRPIDLLLDAQETYELAERLGFTLSGDDARALHLETAGWPALVRAILTNGASPHPGRSGIAIDLQAGEPFLQSVWTELTDRRMQRLIVRTAILDEFTAASAQLCSGLRDVGATLQLLVGSGLLMAERFQDAVVYRYAPAVRHACLDALRRQDPRQFRVVSRRAAQTHTAQGRSATALALLSRASLWEDVAQLVDAFWVELVAESPDEIAAAVAAMPSEVLERHARLVIARDHLLPLHKPAGDPADHSRSHVLDLAAVGPASVERREVFALPGVAEAMEQSLAQIAILRMTGDFMAARVVAERDHDAVLLQVEDLRNDVRDELAPVLHEWAVTRLLAADLPGALSAFREAAELAGEHHHPAIVREASVGAALACAMLGYLEPAEAWLAAAARAPVGYDQDPTADKIVATVRGIVALERIDIEAAVGAAAFDVPEEAGEFWALAAMIRAQVALFDGSHFRVLGEIEAARVDGGVPGLREALLVAASVDLNLAIGHFSRARTAIAGFPQSYEITGLARARTEYFSGEFARAVDVATRWLKTRIYAPANRLDFLLILTGAEHARGRRYEAAVALEEAVAISLATGLLRAFLKVPRATLRDLSTEVPRIAAILDREGLADAAELFPAPTASAQLSEREREVLESLATNASLAGVARSLYLSSNTVKTHLRSIYRKLGTHSSVETVERAWELGLISRPE